jgi:hypothetical protein
MSFAQDIANKTIKLENADCRVDVEILTELAEKIYASALGHAKGLDSPELTTEELTKQIDFVAKASFFFADRFITQKNKHLTYMRKP